MKENEVLIKVAYSPVTNFDKACLNVKKSSLKLKKEEGSDMILGSEGSGIIEECGPGVDQSLKGKKCAFSCCGWSDYSIHDVNRIIIFEDNVDLR